MKIIIVGGSKIGFYLAKTLKEHDYVISVIEENRSRSQSFANSLDVSVIWGDGTKAQVLEEAGIKTCDSIIAVTGQDEDNLIVCQIAKKLYGTPKTIAKVNNPKNVHIFKTLGVDLIVSSTDNIIHQLEREVDNSRIKELVPLNDGKAAVFEILLPENYALAHKQILDLDLPESCNIISITRNSELIIPRGKTKLMSLDKLLVVTAVGAVGEVKKALKLKK